MSQFVSKNKVAFFYVFAFAISWISWGLMFLIYDGKSTSPAVYLFSSLGGLGPLLSLLLLQKLTNQAVSVKQILSKINLRQTKIQWAIPAIIAIPAFTIISNLIYYFVQQERQLQLIQPGPDDLGIWVLLVMAIHFIASLVTSPLFEEPGWRGFALPQLQKRLGNLFGSLVVGILWWIWHQPMNLTFGLQPTLYSALSMITFSFIIDSLFKLSGQNLFIAMLAHQSYGTVFTFLARRNEDWLELSFRILFLVILKAIEITQFKTPEEIKFANRGSGLD